MRRYIQLFWSFFKIGCFTFGGGYAMLPLMQREIIERRGWLKEDEFVELLALAQISPGPVSLNTAVFVGFKRSGYAGAGVALLGTVVPSFVIILCVVALFADFRDLPAVESALRGMRPAVVALIAAPLYNMIKGMSWQKIVAAAVVAVLIGFLGVSPVYFLIGGAAYGLVDGIFFRNK